MKIAYQILGIWSYLNVIFLHNCNADGQPNWKWSCNKKSQSCVRISGTDNNSPLNFESQDLCRLSCSQNPIWPQVTVSLIKSNELTPIHPSQITFTSNTENTSDVQEYLNDIQEIFIENLYTYCGTPCKQISDSQLTITITVTSPELTLKWSTSESYKLELLVKKRNEISGQSIEVKIQSETVFGTRHALETLSQLFASYEMTDGQETTYGLMVINGVRIRDQPIYKHRGLLLDTARNFMTIDTIKRQIVAMGASKLNILHWHVTDSQSFGLEIPSVPQFTKYGAYSKSKIYTQKDVKELIRFALLRGVRILIELDAPSHSGYGWQWGPEYNLGNLSVCLNQQPWRSYCIQPPCGQLNPANPNVYKVLGKLYKDVINLQPNQEAIHMGGDELFLPCWNLTKEIVDYLHSKSMGQSTRDLLDLWSEFQTESSKTYDEQIGHNESKIILWTSHLTEPSYIENYLSNHKYVIQTWVPASDPLPTDLLQKGYKIVVSTKNAWYLDHGFWGQNSYYKWPIVYKNKIPRHSNVLGGEVCMWSEYVDNNSVDSRIWPRTSAAAERLWSDPNEQNMNIVLSRLQRHRERLVQLGIRTDVLSPEWCSQNENQCYNYLP